LVRHNCTGGESLSLFEAQEAADIVQDAADEDVNMIFGTVIKLVCVEVLEVALVPKPVLEALRPCEVGLSSKPVASSRCVNEHHWWGITIII
jgi:cell division protein FtsZ